MKRVLTLTLFVIVVALPLSAQQIKLDFPGLSERASEEVNVTLDSRMLRLASKFFSDSRDDRAVKDMIEKLQGIYVRSYEFEHDNEYDASIVKQVRAQLGPEWQRIVEVKSKFKENTDVYTMMKNDTITGLVIITAEPRELTLVNIVGPVDLDRISQLSGHFGIQLEDKKDKQ